MADDYVPSPASPVGGDPILFRPETLARHEQAVRDVLGGNRARYPRAGRGRTTSPSAGFWGQLASGSSITAASGLVLGTGTVTLCSREDDTLAADGEDVTVYNPGGAITGPQILELDWTDGDWAVCRCAVSGCVCTDGVCAHLTNYAPPYGVRSCGICQGPGCATLTIKKGGTVLFSGLMEGLGSGAMGYSSPDIFLTNHLIDSSGADRGTQYYRLDFFPQDITSSGGAAVSADKYTPGSTSYTGDDGSWHLGTGQDPYLCDASGLHAHWTLLSDPGGWPISFGTLLVRYLAATDMYLDIEPYPQACYACFTVMGCNNLPLAGATVHIWTNSAKTTSVGTATTDSSGKACIDIGQVAVSRYYEVTKSPRFTMFSATVSMIPGDVFEVFLPVAAGYYCDMIPACADPLPGTLHATHPKFGPLTLTYNASGSYGAGWYATTSHTYSGCRCCPPKTVTVTSFVNSVLTFSDHWKSF